MFAYFPEGQLFAYDSVKHRSTARQFLVENWYADNIAYEIIEFMDVVVDFPSCHTFTHFVRVINPSRKYCTVLNVIVGADWHKTFMEQDYQQSKIN